MTLDCMLVSEEKPDRPDTRSLATCRLILPCKRHLSVQACFNGLQLADGNCWYSHPEAHYLVAGQVSCSTALPSLLLPAYPPRACPTTASTSTSSTANWERRPTRATAAATGVDTSCVPLGRRLVQAAVLA